MKRIIPHPSLLLPFAAVVAWRMGRQTRPFNLTGMLSRRTILKFAGLGMGAALTGTWRNRIAAHAASARASALAAGCILTPEQTEGPYYIAKGKVRRNIREGRPGTPLTLKLQVVDASTCKPIKGAAVDIWHCDAGGIYSGFESASTGGPGGSGGPTDKHTYLRGIQPTNARGIAEFQTIYPGWYRGRTVHIHVKVHAGGNVVHTGQLYFSDSLTSKVYGIGAYKGRAAARDTFNRTDGIFSVGGAQSMLAVKRNGKGVYTGTIAMGVRRA
jgi:protocatechuate 3,4-dioxygenase beta subunit